MRTVLTSLTLVITGLTVCAQQAAPAGQPQTTPGTAVPGPATPPAPATARTFTAGTGLIFNAVRADRVVDFEMVIGYLQAALERSTDPTVRAQAEGWRVFKAAEPGPNATVLYVFLLDPTVASADYGLGRILSDAYPDQVRNIWKLYTGALVGGGSLLNLAPVQPPPLPLPQPGAQPLIQPAAPPLP